MRKRIFFLSIVVFLLSGCTPMDRLAPPNSAWLDHFDISRSGWKTTTDEFGSVQYDMNGLRITIDEPNKIYVSTLDFWYQNVIVKVDAAKISGSDEGNMAGLICRYQDEKNYYMSAVSTDQTYAIFKLLDGELVTISGMIWMPEPIISPGNGVNQIEMTCDENIITLKINGSTVDHAVDSEFSTGKVGVIAGSGGDGGVDIVFDQFTSRAVNGE